MDDENRWDNLHGRRGRNFNREWDHEGKWKRPGRGEWDYEGPYDNRSSFNPGWDMDREYGQGDPREYGYSRDTRSGRDYGYGRDFERSMGRDYGRGGFNRGRRGMMGNIKDRGQEGGQGMQRSEEQGVLRGVGREEVIMPGRIREGLEVVGSDGERVGKVKEVRSNDFLVDRPMARDVYIPFTACKHTDGEVVLQIRADEVSGQNWPAPSLFGMGGEGQEDQNS